MRAPFVIIVPLLLCSAIPASAQSAFDGNWKADAGSAKFDPKPDVMMLRDGHYSCSSCAPPYSVAADGEFHPIPGHPYADAVAISVKDPRTVIERDRKNGKVTGESTSTISADGKVMTIHFTDYSAPNGKIVTGDSTEERVGTLPVGAHAFSGSWRQIKVTGISDDGLLFSIRTKGDAIHYETPTGQHIDARFGGGYAPLIGDVGGTRIKYERIDARTMRSTSMRAGKVVSIATVKAAPDGKSMANTERDLLHGTTNTYKAVRQ